MLLTSFQSVMMTPIFQFTLKSPHFPSVFDLSSFHLILIRINGDGAKKFKFLWMAEARTI